MADENLKFLKTPELKSGIPALSQQLTKNLGDLVEMQNRRVLDATSVFQYGLMQELMDAVSSISQDPDGDVIAGVNTLLNDPRFSDFLGIKPDLGDAFSISENGIMLHVHRDENGTSKYDLDQNLLPYMANGMMVTINATETEGNKSGESKLVLSGRSACDEETPSLNVSIPGFEISTLEYGSGFHITSIGEGDTGQLLTVENSGVCRVGKVGQKGVVVNVFGRVDIGESQGEILTQPYAFTTVRMCAGSIQLTSNARVHVEEMVLRQGQPEASEGAQINMTSLRRQGDYIRVVEPVLVIDNLRRVSGGEPQEGHADIRMPKQSAVIHIRNCKAAVRVEGLGEFASRVPESDKLSCTLATDVHGDVSVALTDGEKHTLQRVSANGKLVQKLLLTTEEIEATDREIYDDGSWYFKVQEGIHLFGQDGVPTYLGLGRFLKMSREMPKEFRSTRLNF